MTLHGTNNIFVLSMTLIQSSPHVRLSLVYRVRIGNYTDSFRAKSLYRKSVNTANEQYDRGFESH